MNFQEQFTGKKESEICESTGGLPPPPRVCVCTHVYIYNRNLIGGQPPNPRKDAQWPQAPFSGQRSAKKKIE